MPNLTAANLTRLNAALDKQYRFAHGVDTFRNLIAKGVYGEAESESVPKITYNRRKFNRMNEVEAEQYRRKLKETKTEYRLLYADDPEAYTVVPKMVHDYFKGLAQ